MLHTKEYSPYYKEQKIFEIVACYYTRTMKNGKWIVADCDNKIFTYRKDEGYRYAGIRPAMYIYSESP